MPFQYPNITGKTEKEQIAQIKNHLFQITDQLNYVVSQFDKQIQEIRKDSAANDSKNK
jgi:hypothetical protein